jgi:3-hydroxyacyl-CoA dehydrogenase/enoyl-CoA hydratase/3-hydroxybutyryl-CoA epimerase
MPTGDALQMLFKGDQIRPLMARNMGLVHQVVTRDSIVSAAKEWIRNGGSAVAPWDQKGYRLPSNKVYSAAGMQIWPPANAIYRRETQDNYPAAYAILEAVYQGLQLPMDLALKVESRWFARILRSKEAAAMIRTLFVSMGELNKGARRPKDVPASSLKKVGVVGAGFMGAGIAYVTANAGIEVVLVDRDQEAAEKGKAYSHKLMSDQIMKGRAKTADRDALLARITPSADYADLKDCDLIIEAVFEEMAVKKEVFAKIEGIAKPGAILASNTSYLDFNVIAQSTSRPASVLGTHFFSPANVMRLLEIVRGKATAPDVLATAIAVGRKIGKVPAIVGVCHGFVGNRMLRARSIEAERMLIEGALPQDVDAAITEFGFPMGPFAMGDLAGLDIGWRNRKSLGRTAAIADALCEAGRFGQKTGKGYYKYEGGSRAPLPDPDVEKLIDETLAKLGLKRRQISDDEILERMVYPMINEGARLLDTTNDARNGTDHVRTRDTAGVQV